MQQLAVNQYVTRVRFTETIERLYDDGARIFIEVGPSGNLTAFVRDILKDRPHLAVASNVRRQGGIVQFQQLLAQLFCAQVPMDLRVLFPPTVVAAAAALTPAPARPTERPLASELPYVKITAEEGARLRELFQPDLSAGAPASGEVKATTEATSPPMAATASEQALQPAQAAGPPAVAGNGSGPQPAVVLDGKTGQMIQHFALMNQFLSQHGAVTSAMAARRPGHNHRPWVQDWNRLFAVPYPVEVQFAGYAGSSQGGPSTGDLEALAKGLLSASELAFWREQLAGRNVHRGQEWLLGRLAGKQAVRMWLARHYRTTALVRDIEILSDQSGAPVVGLRNGLKHLQDLPVVSISHVDGCAVAVAADHRRRTGVDLERITRVRDAAGFADRVVAKSEQAVLRHRLPGSERETGVLVWSIKEAAAKALGVGFLGREKEFVLTALSPDDGRGQVLHNGDLVNVQVRRLGDYYCALAYCSAENAGRPIPHQ
jgi:acyl transferase domain-containing protein